MLFRSCQDQSGNTLKVATSTVFSQAIIDAQITPIATTTIANIQKSQKALALIQDLITGITGTSSLYAQRISLEQLDLLVARRLLHNPDDLQNVRTQLSDVKDSMQNEETGLIAVTVKDWADGTPSDSAFSATNQTGWCNVNSQTTLDAWAKKWKQ